MLVSPAGAEAVSPPLGLLAGVCLGKGVVREPMLIALLAFWMLREQGNDAVIYVVIGSSMTGL